MRPTMSRPRSWIAVLVGIAGVVSALALPFAPVVAQTTTLTWPAPGRPAVSSTVLTVPYRPLNLTASLPCPVLRAAAAQTGPVTVLSTGDGGLTVTGSPGSVLLRTGEESETITVPPAPADCRVTVEAGPSGLSVVHVDGHVIHLGEQPVPEVFELRTDLDPTSTLGLSVTAVIGGPFGTTPTTAKAVLVAVQLLCAAAALLLLLSGRLRRPRLRRSRLWWIDAAVIAILCGWAVIGPLAVDDGWATTIARTIAATGDPGNYYRWWNAAEVPFALSEELLAPLTRISLAPLWLRVPSTLLAIATWFALSRGVLGAALPRHTGRVRVLAALCLLVTWLPFNLGTRPESFVALGVTAALALAWRTCGPAGLGLLALAVALTVPISPTGVLVAAPILVFADRLRAAARAQPTAARGCARIRVLRRRRHAHRDLRRPDLGRAGHSHALAQHIRAVTAVVRGADALPLSPAGRPAGQHGQAAPDPRHDRAATDCRHGGSAAPRPLGCGRAAPDGGRGGHAGAVRDRPVEVVVSLRGRGRGVRRVPHGDDRAGGATGPQCRPRARRGRCDRRRAAGRGHGAGVRRPVRVVAARALRRAVGVVADTPRGRAPGQPDGVGRASRGGRSATPRRPPRAARSPVCRGAGGTRRGVVRHRGGPAARLLRRSSP
ncbi:hypothetical protein FK535_07870 [Mycolicibacterium sp. 018/SC-01/001]|nr:hypothetical protein FK535_07870 [Mycolicibacterium sp. 018/SC-01/001]